MSLGLISELLLIAVIVLLCWAVREFGSAIWYAGKLAGPVAYPLFGNGLQFLNLPRAELLPVLGGLIKRYGDCFRLWLGTHLLVIINDPKDIEAILSNPKCIDKSIEYSFFRLWLGDGLLTSTGHKWRTHRKIITPSFHFKILEQFVDIFDQQSSILVRKLEPFARETGESFDLFPVVSLCTLDIFYESAMGVTMNAQLNSESGYVRAVKEMTSLIQDRFYDFLLRYEFFFRFSANRRRQLKALKVLHGYTNRVVITKREELAKKSATTEPTRMDGDAEVGTKKRMAFLEMLLQSTIDGEPLTDLEIRDEVNTFMLGGHDTTVAAISFLLHSLANYDCIQQKLFDEVRSIVGDDLSESPTMAMLNDMNYLELVIKETLRLYPSAPLFGRKMMENTEINGKIFPAGANVVVCPFFLGRNPKYFPNPLVFDPERFNVETSAEKTNPYQYIPFSAGPRNCIGQKFAMLEIKSVISKVLRHYEILPAPVQQDIVLVAETVLRPLHGLPIRIRPRKY